MEVKVIESEVPVLDLYGAFKKEEIDFLVKWCKDNSACEYWESRLRVNEKISKGLRNYYFNISMEERQRLRDEGLARWLGHSEEWLLEHSRLTSAAMANMTSSQVEERGKSISEGQKAYWDSLTPEERAYKNEVNSQAQFERWDKASPEQVEYWLGCMVRGNSSLPEALLGLYLDREFPERWLHNGSEGRLRVGRFTPDFVSIEGKYLIELFGDYWHPTEEETSRVDEYKSRGWFCLVVWEYEVWLGLDLKSRLGSLGF